MKTVILFSLFIASIPTKARAGDCRKFVDEYSTDRLSLVISADRSPEFLQFKYSDSFGSTYLFYHVDGVDHAGDGGVTGDTYNAVCTDERIKIKETFNGKVFFRELLPTPTGIIQFGSIAGQPEQTRAMKRIK